MQLTFKFILLGLALVYGVLALPVQEVTSLMDRRGDIELFPRMTQDSESQLPELESEYDADQSSGNVGGICSGKPRKPKKKKKDLPLRMQTLQLGRSNANSKLETYSQISGSCPDSVVTVKKSS